MKPTCKIEKRWPDSLVRVSSEMSCCRQKSCLCHSISSILIILTSAHSASGSSGQGGIGEKKNLLIYLGREVWGETSVCHNPLCSNTLPQNHTSTRAHACTHIRTRLHMQTYTQALSHTPFMGLCLDADMYSKIIKWMQSIPAKIQLYSVYE